MRHYIIPLASSFFSLLSSPLTVAGLTQQTPLRGRGWSLGRIAAMQGKLRRRTRMTSTMPSTHTTTNSTPSPLPSSPPLPPCFDPKETNGECVCVYVCVMLLFCWRCAVCVKSRVPNTNFSCLFLIVPIVFIHIAQIPRELRKV